MTPISTHAESLRETSRARDGKFGEQGHADPGLVDVPTTALGPLGVLPERVESEDGGFSWWDFAGPWGLPEEDDSSVGGDPYAEAQGRVDPVEYVPEWPWSAEKRGMFIAVVLSGMPVPRIVVNERFPLSGDQWPVAGPSGEPTLGLAVLSGREQFLTLHQFTGDQVAVPAECFDSSYVSTFEAGENGHPMVRYSQLTKGGRDWVKSRLRVPVVRLRLPDARSELAAAHVLSWA